MPSSNRSRRWAIAALVTAIATIAACGVPALALAASPTPSPAGGDPRSVGQGPGLVGDPLTAILVVVAIGVVALAATLAYVRLTSRRGDRKA